MMCKVKSKKLMHETHPKIQLYGISYKFKITIENKDDIPNSLFIKMNRYE